MKGRHRDGRRANASEARRHDRRRGKKQKKKNKKRNRPLAAVPPANPGTGTPPPPVCTPSCAGKACGDDGCDGLCPPGCPSTAPECNAEGLCVGCLADDDCPDPGPCQTRRCVDGTCSSQPVTDGIQCGANERCCGGACRECCTDAHCTAPSGGTVTCMQGLCSKRCDNPLHRLCGSNRDVCQECCSTDQCSSIHSDSTCGGDGTCQCPNGLTRCGMECVDTSRDPNHCGTCPTKCPGGTCEEGECRVDECGGCPPQIEDCEPLECPGDKVCSRLFPAGTCSCLPGWIDCDGDGVCESCGRCGVTSCPPDPANNEPGECCAGGYCSCGGSCEVGCETCWVTSTRQGEGTVITREVCEPGCVDCWGMCCTACINGECASSGPIGGARIRR
jgi:hypothetical protein